MSAAELLHVLTVEEAARLLRVGRSAAYEAVRAGEIPTIRIGRSIRVPRVALEALLAGEPGQGQPEPTGLRVIEGGGA